MPRFSRPQISTAILALCAVFSLAFAPNIDGDSEAAAEEAGRCLEGYAYVEVAGSTHGITSPLCVVSTDCESSFRVGPAGIDRDVVGAYYYLRAPLPAGLDATCYA